MPRDLGDTRRFNVLCHWSDVQIAAVDCFPYQSATGKSKRSIAANSLSSVRRVKKDCDIPLFSEKCIKTKLTDGKLLFSRLTSHIRYQHTTYRSSIISVKMKFSLVLVLLPGLTSSFTAPSAFGVKTSPSSISSALFAGPDVNGSADKKKVIVLGGDGFCGWPTSLYLSDKGHDVVIVDNLSRRNIDIELGCDSLTLIRSPEVITIIFRPSRGICLYGCSLYMHF